MTPLGDGHYTTLTKFVTPWEFYIQDNFLSHDVCNLLNGLKSFEELYTFVDNSMLTAVGKKSPIKKSIPLYKNKDITQQIERTIKHKLQPLLIDNLYVQPDLVCCEPGYVYQTHKDHPDKYISIVVFLHPRKGNGTILLDDNKQLYNVGWKVNRALIFQNDTHGEHYYVNSTEHNRYTLNIYITKHKSGRFFVEQ